ncbi:hypothetical protein GG344DRAFT_80414 [Lentinula edodes]|nr:hypothetical protein GG344DRAFT_80414 [Lentinula edodes]
MRSAHLLKHAITLNILGVGATAPDADSACRCPNNCSHKLGSSCAFFQDGNTIKGACVNGDGGLTCST